MKILSYSLALMIVLAGAACWAIRPGVYTIQPLGAFPEGVTFLYHSRGPGMPLFSSPDGLCLQTMGSVSLLCRGIAVAGSRPLIDRLLLKLPYSELAYLASTGGQMFDR